VWMKLRPAITMSPHSVDTSRSPGVMVAKMWMAITGGPARHDRPQDITSGIHTGQDGMHSCGTARGTFFAAAQEAGGNVDGGGRSAASCDRLAAALHTHRPAELEHGLAV